MEHAIVELVQIVNRTVKKGLDLRIIRIDEQRLNEDRGGPSRYRELEAENLFLGFQLLPPKQCRYLRFEEAVCISTDLLEEARGNLP